MTTRHKPRSKDAHQMTELSLLGQPLALFAGACFESVEDRSAWEYCMLSKYAIGI
jgi:hypothetical protein